MEKSSTAHKWSVKKRVTLAVTTLLLVTVALAFILPFTGSNGTEKFSGDEAEIAKQAIGDGSYEGPSVGPIPDPAISFKAKVKDVKKSEPEKQCQTGAKMGTTYIVEVSKITFFGLENGGYYQPICWFKN